MKSNITRLQIMSSLRGAAFYLPIISLFFISQGVALSAIVISQVFYAIFLLVGNVPSGIFGDKFGHKKAILLGHGISAIAYIGLAFIPGIFGLFFAYSMRGFGNSFIGGSDEALLYESTNQAEGSSKNFKKYMGGYVANDVIGFAVATLIAGLALARFGSDSYIPLILVTAATEVAALAIGLSLKNPQKVIQKVRQKSSKLLRQSLSLIRHNKTVLTLVLVPMLTFSGEYFLYGVYQPYFQSAQVAPLMIGMVLSIGAVLNFFVLRYAHKLENYLPLEKIILVFSIFMAVNYAIMAIFMSPVLLVMSFIFLKGSFNGQTPIISDYIHEHTESHIRATVSSSISFIQQIAQILIRIVLGILVGAIGISHTLGIQAIYLVVGVGIAYWVMVRCGCTHHIHVHNEYPDKLAEAEIPA